MERGRAFREEDRGVDQNVVILNQALARRMFPREDAIGKQFNPGCRGPWFTVIGVAGNVKNSGLVDEVGPEYYIVRKHTGENVGGLPPRSSVPPPIPAAWLTGSAPK